MKDKWWKMTLVGPFNKFGFYMSNNLAVQNESDFFTKGSRKLDRALRAN